MNKSYLRVNLVDVKKGDLVTVVDSVFRHSGRHLTVGKVYKVIAVKTYEKEHMKTRNTFTIVTDAGVKRDYQFKNMMFSMADDSQVYNNEQKRLMHAFSREMESLTQSWNKHHNDVIHEEAVEYKVHEYLVKIMRA